MQTYCLVQIDDDGRRIITTGCATARQATTWNASHPEGGERFEIGTDE